MFVDLGKPIADGVNQFVRHLIVNYGDGFEAVSGFILKILLFIETGLRDLHPAVLLAVVFGLAWASSRHLLMAAGLTFLMWLIGCFGLWEQAMQTLAIVLVAVLISALIGLPLGVLSARSTRFRAVLSPILDLMQTIPSFVYLIPAAMLFGLGKVPAVLATVIYAAPPLIRLTELGIRQVNAEVVEASRAFGATRWQMLRGVQLPLALPSIMAGLNQTMMMALAMVVIASMIGARGVGETVLLGLQRNDAGRGLIGGLVIVILAIVLDRITQNFGRRMQIRGGEG
ncbi:proline/glycine betaine ABC transporter permease [Neomegalonema sp.]|uniref:ABC transporter permease n=1 Tax=Neomegalonema sp. TaxID=2039713 RepID=UPI00261043EF|nr:proline/glycine betaine ABC transporter permease [Neomegalonema sp.]MDD2869947.1 proline/glycine betaine ABC transporter permease [Neomegalonema sp.]